MLNKKLLLVSIASLGLVACGGSKKPVAEPVEAPMVEQPAPEPKMEPAPMMEKVEAIEPAVKSIYFGFDKFNVEEQFHPVIHLNVDYIKDENATYSSVVVEGNTDSRGSKEYNLALGQKRADAVKEELVEHGVSADKVTAISFGEEKPKMAGNSEEAWSQNRRSDIVYK